MQKHTGRAAVVDDAGEPLLTAFSGNHDMPNGVAVELCLDLGADTNAATHSRRCALHRAAAAGHVDVVRILLNANARAEPRDGFAQTPLMEACHGGHTVCARLLLESGACVNASDDRGLTPLLHCCSARPINAMTHVATARDLLERGAEVNVQAEGASAIFIAARRGSADMVALLASCPQMTTLNAKSAGGGTPLFVACQLGGLYTAIELLSAGADASIGRTNPGITQLLEAGPASVLQTHVYGDQHWCHAKAVGAEALPIMIAAQEQFHHLVRELVQRGHGHPSALFRAMVVLLTTSEHQRPTSLDRKLTWPQPSLHCTVGDVTWRCRMRAGKPCWR